MMLIRNFNPEKIESDFNKLKEKIEIKNKFYQLKYKGIMTIRGMITVIFTIVLGLVWKHTLTHNISNIYAVLGTLTFAIFLGIGIAIFCEGPKCSSLYNSMTFAMKFWAMFKDVKIISVE